MSDADHLELLKTIKKLKAKVMISSYPNELYDEKLSNWHRILVQQPNHVAGGVIKGFKVEAIYLNYKPKDLK
jgi:DNA adenine methylase